MPDYVWVSDTPRIRPRSGDRYEKGDEIDPTDHELRAFGDRIEPIDEDTSDGAVSIGDVGEEDTS